MTTGDGCIQGVKIFLKKKLLLLFGQALTLFGQLVLGLGWVVLYTVGGTGVVYR